MIHKILSPQRCFISSVKRAPIASLTINIRACPFFVGICRNGNTTACIRSKANNFQASSRVTGTVYTRSRSNRIKFDVCQARIDKRSSFPYDKTCNSFSNPIARLFNNLHVLIHESIAKSCFLPPNNNALFDSLQWPCRSSHPQYSARKRGHPEQLAQNLHLQRTGNM